MALEYLLHHDATMITIAVGLTTLVTLEYLLHHDATMITIAVGLTTLVTLTLLLRAVRFIRLFRYFQSFPGEQSYSPLMGNLHKLPTGGEDRIAYGRSLMDKGNHRFARIWAGPFRPNIITYHPDTAKLILKSSAPKSRGFGQIYELAAPWIGEGLISSNGSRWARSRRLLTPAFHFDILKPYMDVYNNSADTLIEKLDKFAESGESFNLCPLITLCTLEIILKCAMGYEADVQRKGHPYAKAVRELTWDWINRARRPYLWFDFIFHLTSMGRRFYKNCDYVHKVAEEVIEKRRQSLKKNGQPKSRHLDFLDVLLTARDEDGNPMTPLEIRNEVDTFMFAGHDTTANSTPWIIYSLVQNPEYQAKIRTEVDNILEGRDSDHIHWSDLPKLEMLALCIKEAMRLYPPVPMIARILNEDIMIDGKKIPAGTNVFVAIIHLHRNPKVWEKPDEFKPERFRPESVKERDSFSFTPFSAGSRNCIGQNFALNEEKVLVARLFHRYEIEMAPDGPPVKRAAVPILQAEHGIWLRLKFRGSPTNRD